MIFQLHKTAMALTEKKKGIIILLTVLAIFICLFGLMYVRPANQLVKYSDCNINQKTDTGDRQQIREFSFKWFQLILVVVVDMCFVVWGTTFIIDMIHDTGGSSGDGFLRKLVLTFIVVTGFFTIATYLWVIEFSKYPEYTKNEFDSLVRSSSPNIFVAQLTNEQCKSINNLYVLQKFLPPYFPALYDFWMCFSAFYADHRLSKTTGYPSIDAANRKLINFFREFNQLALMFTAGIVFIPKGADAAAILIVGFLIGILSAFAAIAALVWWEGQRPTERPTQLRLLREMTILHGGRQIILRLFELPHPNEPIPNAN